MSYRQYSGGDSQRVQRHQQQYDPYAESDRHGYGGGQLRRDDYEREDSGRTSGYASRSYGGSSAAAAAIPARQMGYTSGRSAPTAPTNYGSGQYGAGSSSGRSRETSGFPSGIQESDVWRTNSNAPSQQRPSRQTVNYTHGSERDVYRANTWGSEQSAGSGSGRQQQTVSYNSYKGSGQGRLGVTPPPPTQPVLMMVPQGSANNLMGLVANPFAVQRQAGMQMVLGSLPAALNPNIFDQHLIGSGQYGVAGAHQHNQRSSGRSNDRGASSYGSVRGSRGSASSRGGGRRTPPTSVRRRTSPGPGRGVHRNAVYRKPININPPPNPIAKKRVSDRADFGDKKKMKIESTDTKNAAVPTKSPVTPSGTRSAGNQRRREKRRRDAEARAAAAASGSTPKKATPTLTPTNKDKKVEGKEDKSATAKKEEDSKGVATETEKKETSAATTEKQDDEVVVIEAGDGAVAKVEVEEKKRKSKYDDFPPALLVCKVCQKSMNDGASFESHLSGRAHTALVKIVEERFQKRAEMLMLESRLSEEEIGVELERQRRAGKSGGNSNKANNQCKMCDCTYTVNWGTHKISLGHRILKEFLHPICRYCDANFVHRMDWLNHLFSLSHLRRVSEQRSAGKDTTSHESATQEELFTISLEMNQEEKPANFLTIRNLDWKIPTPSHIKDILEEGDAVVPEGELVIPEEFDENVVTGRDAIITTTGYCCKVCRTYMTQEKEVEVHCKGKSHFGMYVSYLKKMVKLQEDQKAAARKAEAEKKDSEDVKIIDEVTEDGTTVAKDEGDGENEEDAENADMNGEEEMEEEGEGEEFLEDEATFNDSLEVDGSLNESELLNETLEEEIDNEDEKMDCVEADGVAQTNTVVATKEVDAAAVGSNAEIKTEAEPDAKQTVVKKEVEDNEGEAKKIAEAKEAEAKKIAEAKDAEAKKIAEAKEAETKKLAEAKEAEAKKITEAEAEATANEVAVAEAKEAEAKKNAAEVKEAEDKNAETEVTKVAESAEGGNQAEAKAQQAIKGTETQKLAEPEVKEVVKQNGNEVKSVPAVAQTPTARGRGAAGGRGGGGGSPARRGFAKRGAVAPTPAARGQMGARGNMRGGQPAERSPRGRPPMGGGRGRGGR